MIGELGMAGTNVTRTKESGSRILGIRQAQINVCNQVEFRNNTKFVRTSPFAVLDGMKYDGIEHYYGRADTVFHIGQAFALAMIGLLARYR